MYTVKHILTDQESVDLRDDLLEKYPLDPPTESPIDPPVDPEPPVVPPVVQPPNPGMSNKMFEGIWGRRLSPDVRFYGNNNIRISKTEMSIAMLIPIIDTNYRLKMTRLENTATTGSAFGVLSNRRDFNKPYHASHTWGLGGGVSMTVTPADSGKMIYFNMRMNTSKWPWRTTLQPDFKRL